MKIAIIGAGISGCTAYLQLKKHLPEAPDGARHSITIYEAYDTDKDTDSSKRGQGPTHSSTLIVGGGLGVGANGLKVLERLDQELLKDIVRGGYTIGTMTMKSKSGQVLVRTSSNGKAASTSTDDRHMNMVASSRHSLWRCLRMRIPDNDIITKRISDISIQQDGPNTIFFADGSKSVDADLVLGADGLKSTVKRALFQEQTEDPFPPNYE
jgi:2-polyprenyl-6-methoxyphenol hydroxylase-like FAD-dependent oxidoreductase